MYSQNGRAMGPKCDKCDREAVTTRSTTSYYESRWRMEEDGAPRKQEVRNIHCLCYEHAELWDERKLMEKAMAHG